MRVLPAVAAVVAVVCLCHVDSAVARPGELPMLLPLINVRATTIDIDAGISLSVTPDKVTNGDFVTVTWSGVTSPSAGDWIGM